MTDSPQPDDTGRQAAPHDDDERLRDTLARMSEEQFRRQMRQAARLLSSGNGRDQFRCSSAAMSSIPKTWTC